MKQNTFQDLKKIVDSDEINTRNLNWENYIFIKFFSKFFILKHNLLSCFSKTVRTTYCKDYGLYSHCSENPISNTVIIKYSVLMKYGLLV